MGYYEVEHHNLDPYPVPKEKEPLYVNETTLTDMSFVEKIANDMEKEDNVRIYAPIDINADAIMRRLYHIINKYGEANERNESDFSIEVRHLFSQVEIYDQVWFIRDADYMGKHSRKGVALVREFVKALQDIPDGCAELFPFEMIDWLAEEYLSGEIE